MDNNEPISTANQQLQAVFSQFIDFFEELPEGHPDGTPLNQRMIEGLEYYESRH